MPLTEKAGPKKVVADAAVAAPDSKRNADIKPNTRLRSFISDSGRIRPSPHIGIVVRYFMSMNPGFIPIFQNAEGIRSCAFPDPPKGSSLTAAT